MCALTDQGVLYSVLWKGTNSSWEALLFFIDLERMLKEKEGSKYKRYLINMLEYLRSFY